MAYASYQKKEYQQSDDVRKAQEALLAHQSTKPGDYASKYQQQIENLYGKITNRPKFSYNVNEDALYQSMAQRYQQQGKQAMMDAMGQAAALTGGYGSSYGQSVGQQTYQGYLQGLADMVPDYYNMALQAYNAEGDDLARQYSMALEREGQDYSRWQDRNNAYLQELSRLQGVYESERNFDYNRYATEQDFDYNAFVNDRDLQYRQDRDAVSDNQWLQQYQYQQERDRISDSQWQQQFNESRRQWEAQLAWEQSKFAQELAQKRAAAAAKEDSSSGGGSGGVSGVLDLGRGPLSMDYLADLVARGEVAAEKKGNTVYVSNTGKKSNGPSHSVAPSPFPKMTTNPYDVFKKKK